MIAATVNHKILYFSHQQIHRTHAWLAESPLSYDQSVRSFTTDAVHASDYEPYAATTANTIRKRTASMANLHLLHAICLRRKRKHFAQWLENCKQMLYRRTNSHTKRKCSVAWQCGIHLHIIVCLFNICVSGVCCSGPGNEWHGCCCSSQRIQTCVWHGMETIGDNRQMTTIYAGVCLSRFSQYFGGRQKPSSTQTRMTGRDDYIFGMR